MNKPEKTIREEFSIDVVPAAVFGVHLLRKREDETEVLYLTEKEWEDLVTIIKNEW